MRILFLIHRRIYSSFGLSNSCNFVAHVLSLRYPTEVIEVDDGNGIDRVVHRYKPTHVFIEALWVTPAKLRELARLHKGVRWFVRIHSHIPFLAQEGIALQWMDEYRKIPNVFLGANDERTVKELGSALDWKVALLPTGYWPGYSVLHLPQHGRQNHPVNVGCFGALRPFKNQLIQAFAAITFARAIERPLNFHINGPDVGLPYASGPAVGVSVLKNLHSLFGIARNAKLVVHGWYRHRAFLDAVNAMDVGMQVSFTETFNIVAADFAWNSIPIITSKEMSWMDTRFMVDDPSDPLEIAAKLHFAYEQRFGTEHLGNFKNLQIYNRIAYHHWMHVLDEHK